MKAKLGFLVILAVMVLGGCAFTTDVVKIDYTPSSYSKITDCQKSIEVKRIKDMRGVEPTLLSYKGTQYKTSGKYLAEKEVSDIVTDSLKGLLSNLNYKVTGKEGDLVLSGEILKFDQQVIMGFWSGALEGNIQLALKLAENNTGNILWSEIISGYGKKTGLQVDRDVHRKEVIEKALDNLMSNMANSDGFKKAIERYESK